MVIRVLMGVLGSWQVFTSTIIRFHCSVLVFIIVAHAYIAMSLGYSLNFTVCVNIHPRRVIRFNCGDIVMHLTEEDILRHAMLNRRKQR